MTFVIGHIADVQCMGRTRILSYSGMDDVTTKKIGGEEAREKYEKLANYQAFKIHFFNSSSNYKCPYTSPPPLSEPFAYRGALHW